MMRKLIKMVALLAFIGNRDALAQTVGVAKSPTASVIATTPLKPMQDSRSTRRSATVNPVFATCRSRPSANSSASARRTARWIASS